MKTKTKEMREKSQVSCLSVTRCCRCRLILAMGISRFMLYHHAVELAAADSEAEVAAAADVTAAEEEEEEEGKLPKCDGPPALGGDES